MLEAFIWSVLAFNGICAIGTALVLVDDGRPRDNFTLAGLVINLFFVGWAVMLLVMLRA